MSCKLNRSAYEKMIKENLEWLEHQPNTIENAHIKLIVERSANHEYDKAGDLADAKREAESLALYLWEKHYKEDSPNFELCDSVAGVISQIDNMTTGLSKA
jgi:hypothetical protein